MNTPPFSDDAPTAEAPRVFPGGGHDAGAGKVLGGEPPSSGGSIPQRGAVGALRSAFLDYFVAKGHTYVPSSPLVPNNDPTLLFTTAGMVPFKDLFTGKQTPTYTKAVSCQKCVRAGGKHNDLDQVGYTARHHTFFEMLGNFSFGDYFKEEAIFLAWEFVTRNLELDPARLLVTVYVDDVEAHQWWKKIAGLPDDRIIKIATKDNFWSMGDTGPCGPCTEIFYDNGEHVWGGKPGSAHQDGDRFSEIWNLVFMQYEQLADGRRIDLPKPCVDTGMGLERMAAVVQGVENNFDIDLFQDLIQGIATLTGVDPHKGMLSSFRVVADHLRTACFLMADGVMPSNEGRGYVLRRIMRRAMRHAHQLSPSRPLLYQLVPDLVRLMGGVYPELQRGAPLATQLLQLEEERFRRTLDRGLKLLDEAAMALSPGEPLSGDVAFKLYDTYGFPLDLTQDVMRQHGGEVDQQGFDAAMAVQKATARAAWSGSGAVAHDDIWYDLKESVGSCDFIGYESLRGEAIVTALVGEDTSGGRRIVHQLGKGEEGWVVTNQTPFYGESGGQAGDRGTITLPSGNVLMVSDTQKKVGDLTVHKVAVEEGCIATGDVVTMLVDKERRAGLRVHHSATHLLHRALQYILGEHVTQKGSLVEQDRLRFDFSHPSALSGEQMRRVESHVNAAIMANYPVVTSLMSPEDAIQRGAQALFGEKYGDEVRVVGMGGGDETLASLELCGGTHVSRTGDIGFFKLTSESSVAAGIRRVEAVVGEAAVSHVQDLAALVASAARSLGTTPQGILPRIEGQTGTLKAQEKEIQRLQQKVLGSASDGEEHRVGDIVVSTVFVKDVPPKNLKSMVDAIKSRHPKVVAMVIGRHEGKLSCVIGVSPTLVDNKELSLDASVLIRDVAQVLGAKPGGGRADLAQTGGGDEGQVTAAFARLVDGVKKLASHGG